MESAITSYVSLTDIEMVDEVNGINGTLTGIVDTRSVHTYYLLEKHK